MQACGQPGLQNETVKKKEKKKEEEEEWFCDCKACSTSPHASLMRPLTSAIGLTSARQMWSDPVQTCEAPGPAKKRNRISHLLAGKAPLGPMEKCSMYQGLPTEPRNAPNQPTCSFFSVIKLSFPPLASSAGAELLRALKVLLMSKATVNLDETKSIS